MPSLISFFATSTPCALSTMKHEMPLYPLDGSPCAKLRGQRDSAYEGCAHDEEVGFVADRGVSSTSVKS